MSTFAATFGEIVIPDLRRMCAARGLFVALDLADFGEACAEVWTVALRRGAERLPRAALDQLDDWIAAQLLQAEAAARPGVDAVAALPTRDLWRIIQERPWPTSP